MASHRLKIVDVIVCFVALLFATALVIAQDVRSQETARRIKCASNLRQIGQAMLLYANDNKGNYPRTIYKPADEVNPVWGTPYATDEKLDAAESSDPFAPDDKPEKKTRPAPNDVTAAMFLLLRIEEITSEVFICPSSEAEKWDYGVGTFTSQYWTNWKGPKGLREHLSYSMHNPYFNTAAIASGAKWNGSLPGEYAVAADMNPGTEELLKLTPSSSMAKMRAGNSANHRHDGQNVLYGDGHVEFDQNPFCGVQRDNIYAVGAGDNDGDADKSSSSAIIGSPASATDSVLLPTAKSIKAVGADGNLIPLIEIKPATVEEATALRQKIVGKYSLHSRNGILHVTVTDNMISATSGPMTIAYSYEIKGTGGAQIFLTLTAPETKPESSRVEVTPKGIRLSRSPICEGELTRE